MGRYQGKGRGFPAGESLGVGGRKGGREASGVAENPRGDCQGVGGEVKLPRGINTPEVDELPRGGKTSRLIPKGYRIPGED